MSVAFAAQALVLACTLQGVSADGSAYVGPTFTVNLTGPAHSMLTRQAAEISLEGAEKLGLASKWKTRPNFHGSVEILPDVKGKMLSGLLVPEKNGRFSIFWADQARRKLNGAPTTVVSGKCSPIVPADDRKVAQ